MMLPHGLKVKRRPSRHSRLATRTAVASRVRLLQLNTGRWQIIIRTRASEMTGRVVRAG